MTDRAASLTMFLTVVLLATAALVEFAVVLPWVVVFAAAGCVAGVILERVER